MPDAPNETPPMVAAADERIAWINQTVANFAATMEQISGELHAQTVASISTLTPETAAKAKALVELQRDLQKQLNKLDYEGKIQDFIGEYDESQQQAIATLKAMKIDTGRLGPIDDRMLGNLKRMDYKFLSDLGPAAISAVSSGVIRNTIQGMPRAKMIAQVQGTLSGKFVNQACTYADTALSAYDRRATMDVWREAGLDRFTYRGPRDIKNRPFCKEHVGKVYTLAQINRMNNGTTLMPVLVYGGGWNCRHIWTPIPQVPVEKKPPASDTTAEPAVSLAKAANDQMRLAAKKQFAASTWAEESAAEVQQINAVAEAAKAKAAADWAEESAAQVAELNKKAEAAKAEAQKQILDALKKLAEQKAAAEAAAAAAAKAAAEAAAKKAAEEAAAKAAAEAAAKKAAEEAAKIAAQKAAEEKALAWTAKLAAAKNPTQLMEKGTGPDGKPTFTVQDKTYASSGAAWNFAKKLYNAAHPEAAAPKPVVEPTPAVAPKPVLEPAKPTVAPAAAEAAPPGMAAKYIVPGGALTYSYDPATKKYISSDGALAEPHNVALWVQKSWIEPAPGFAVAAAPAPPPAPAPKQPAAPVPPKAEASHVAAYKSPSGATFTWDAGQAAYVSPDYPGHQWSTPPAQWTPIPSPAATPATQPQAVSAAAAAPQTPAEFGSQFTFEKAADVGGIHYKEFYRDQQGNRWLFKPVGSPNEKFMVYADEAAYKVQKAIKGDAIEVRAAEIGGKFGSIQKMETALAEQPDFAKPGAPGKVMDLTKVKPAEIAQLQQEQVVDWMLANHDSHASQYLRTKDGTVYGIDKTQSWKWLGEDKLSPDYRPNEHEPLYNELMRQAKAGKIALDPAAAFKAIRAAEGISDAELVSYVAPYAAERFKSNPAGLADFNQTLIARKNGLRGDFEKLYADLLKQPGFKFAPSPPPTPKEAAAVPAPAHLPRLANAGNVEAANDVQHARAQGRTLRIDGNQIEDQNVHAFHQINGGNSETVLRFKLTGEGENEFLKGLGPLPKTMGAVSGGGGVSDYDLVPYPGSTVSNSVLKKMIAGQITEAEIPVKDGYGNPIDAAKKTTLVKEWKDYAAALKKARAAEAKKTGQPKKAAPDMQVSVSNVVQDSRTFDTATKEILVKQRDQDFAKFGGYGTRSDQMVRVDFKDGTRIRYVRSGPVGSAAYALQNTFELTVPGKLDAAGIEAQLERLEGLGIKGKASTPADEEWMYLAKHAYYNKIEEAAGWKKVAAISDPEARVQAGRKFWSDRMGVKDVTKLPEYNPAGEEDVSTVDPTQRAGKRRFFRFDYSDADFEKATKGMALGHAVVSGSLDDMIQNKVVGAGGYIASRMERIRMGQTLEGGSPGMDISGGGASYLYTSLRNATSPGRIMGEPITIFFKKKLMRRLDSAHFPSDNMGQCNPDNIGNRSKTPADSAARVGGNNEWLFKDGFNFLEWVDVIKPGPTGISREKIIQAFKKAGVTRLPDGRRVEDIVK